MGSSGQVSFATLSNLPPTKFLIFFIDSIFIGSSSCNFLFLILSPPDISSSFSSFSSFSFSFFSLFFFSCFFCVSRFFCLLLAAFSRCCLFFRSYRSSTFAFRLPNSSLLTVGPCPSSSLLPLLAASSCTHCNSSLSDLHPFRAWKELSTFRFDSSLIVRGFSARLLRFLLFILS